MTPNEARERLDLPAKEGGDQLIGNGSTIPITEVGKQWQQQTATEGPKEGDEQPKEDDKPEADETTTEGDQTDEEAGSE